jgi:single-stranded DNA-binding protein
VDPDTGAVDFDDDELKGRSIVGELTVRSYTGSDGEERSENRIRKFSPALETEAQATIATAPRNGTNGNGKPTPKTATRPVAATAMAMKPKVAAARPVARGR